MDMVDTRLPPDHLGRAVVQLGRVLAENVVHESWFELQDKFGKALPHSPRVCLGVRRVGKPTTVDKGRRGDAESMVDIQGKVVEKVLKQWSERTDVPLVRHETKPDERRQELLANQKIRQRREEGLGLERDKPKTHNPQETDLVKENRGLHALVREQEHALRHCRGEADQVPKLIQEIGDLKEDLKLSLIHISEPTRLLSISYAVFCLKKKKRVDITRIDRCEKTEKRETIRG
eukprot:TRINITY_DN44615_c0_g2_i1.p1 TRINITY_DN44615_c0_g2~~TRINITY_DN44615_c0_g2_i1.p1  ORF type:complete len:233 (-),score=52.05 TRINITY_DN44615_c0_g2_i1:1-699(-)